MASHNQLITETLISRLNECHLRNGTTTCQTPKDEYSTSDGVMVISSLHARQFGKEASSLIKSFVNPKETWGPFLKAPGNYRAH